MIFGRSPLRARNTIELLDPAPDADAQPQWVSCSKLNLRRRSFVHRKTPAVAATTVSAAICCQSMPQYTLFLPSRNWMFFGLFAPSPAAATAFKGPLQLPG